MVEIEASVPPRADDPEKILTYIANMADCRVCYPKGVRRSGHRTGFCSAHRDPVVVALGYFYGYNHQGGQPMTDRYDPESSCAHEWRDSGFANLEDCPRCGMVRPAESSPEAGS